MYRIGLPYKFQNLELASINGVIAIQTLNVPGVWASYFQLMLPVLSYGEFVVAPIDPPCFESEPLQIQCWGSKSI